MKLVKDTSLTGSPTSVAGLAARDDRCSGFKGLLAVSATGLLLSLPVQAKPISGCLVQEADLLDPTSCLSPPERLTSTRPSNQSTVVTERDKVARVTLDNIDSGSGGVARSGTGSTNYANCSALRGTHEAQSLMLKSIQKQLVSVERDRRSAKGTLRSLRSSGADEAQLSSAASRLTKINAVWSVLKGDVEKRTKSFNNSMSRLTKACLRG